MENKISQAIDLLLTFSDEEINSIIEKHYPELSDQLGDRFREDIKAF